MSPAEMQASTLPPADLPRQLRCGSVLPVADAEPMRTAEDVTRTVLELAMRVANAEGFARDLYEENQRLLAEIARLTEALR